MCGIAGIIHRDGNADVGSEMTRMLQAMKHRGPDSTGYALFGPESDFVVIRFKLADANDPRGFDFKERLDTACERWFTVKTMKDRKDSPVTRMSGDHQEAWLVRPAVKNWLGA